MNPDFDSMSNEELGKLFPVELSQYNPDWEKQYHDEMRRITIAIGDSNIVRISHIGSTAVKGLVSKPVIDILVEIQKDTDLSQLKEHMEHIGYLTSNRGNYPPNLVFYRGYTEQGYQGQAYHVHVRYPGDWDELYFRDYLQEHPSAANAYSELKQKLAAAFKENREEYTEAKTGYVQSINAMAKQEFAHKYDLESGGTNHEPKN